MSPRIGWLRCRARVGLLMSEHLTLQTDRRARLVDQCALASSVCEYPLPAARGFVTSRSRSFIAR